MERSRESEQTLENNTEWSRQKSQSVFSTFFPFFSFSPHKVETPKSWLKGAEEVVDVMEHFLFFFSHIMSTFAEIFTMT